MEVRQADYVRDHAAIRRIRFAVFVAEQAVPADLELDERDPVCRHVLAFANGEPVGTGRIDLESGGKIGRIAVVSSHRRLGIGKALMDSLHACAREAELPSVWCHAQVAALPFYDRLGYRVVGGVFWEAGIEHRKMVLALDG